MATGKVLDLIFYKNSYVDLESLDENSLRLHWRNHGSKENRICNLNQLNDIWQQLELPTSFSWKKYLFLNPDLPFKNENQTKVHFLKIGYGENRAFDFNSIKISEEIYNIINAFKLNSLIKNKNELNFENFSPLFESIEIKFTFDQKYDFSRNSIINFYKHYFSKIPAPSELNQISTLIATNTSRFPNCDKSVIFVLAIIQIEILKHYFRSLKEHSLHLIGEAKPRNYAERIAKFEKTNNIGCELKVRLFEIKQGINIFLNTKKKFYQEVPKVSLIASLYDADYFIDNFLKNITSLNNFSKCELIFIDANSPGNEREKISSYQERFENIKYFRTNSKIGIYEAWNLGIKNSKSDYIANVNLDDLRLNKYLASSINALDSNNEIDVVFGNFYYSFRANFPIPLVRQANLKSNLGKLTTHGLLNFNSPHSAPMWRRNLHNELGYFDETLVSAGDWDFWLRCASENKLFGQIKDAISVYFQNPNGLSTSLDSADSKEQTVIRSRYREILENPDRTIGKWIA